MIDPTKGPIPLCTVRIRGRNSTVWLFDPPDGSPPLPLSVRRARLAELIRQGEEAGVDPEYTAADRQTPQALDNFIAQYGDICGPENPPSLGPAEPGVGI